MLKWIGCNERNKQAFKPDMHETMPKSKTYDVDMQSSQEKKKCVFEPLVT